MHKKYLKRILHRNTVDNSGKESSSQRISVKEVKRTKDMKKLYSTVYFDKLQEKVEALRKETIRY